MKPLDPNTFGANPAEVNLTKILNGLDDNRLKKKIGKLLAMVTELSLGVNPKNKKSAVTFYMMLKDRFFKSVDEVVKLSNAPVEVETHTKNAITSKLRNLILNQYRRGTPRKSQT